MANDKNQSPWVNYFLQLLAIGLAVLFGVYAILSYPLSKSSVQQAEIANQLSLLSFCSSQTPATVRMGPMAQTPCF